MLRRRDDAERLAASHRAQRGRRLRGRDRHQATDRTKPRYPVIAAGRVKGKELRFTRMPAMDRARREQTGRRAGRSPPWKDARDNIASEALSRNADVRVITNPFESDRACNSSHRRCSISGGALEPIGRATVDRVVPVAPLQPTADLRQRRYGLCCPSDNEAKRASFF